eukprot:m51a1_g4723 hypothetical protein (111) ;mRNA; f:329053-329385
MYARCLHQSLWDELEGARSIVVAGCGGGYDVMAGLPLYFALRSAGARVWLASLSFSDSRCVAGAERLADALIAVAATSSRPLGGWTPETESYWPELRIARWLRDKAQLIN